MASPAKIYDRKAILEAVERDCLGDPGVSGVIVGAQKAGKTSLLQHVLHLGIGRTESLFCRVDMYDLRARGYNDDGFLRLFLEDLQRAVLEEIDELAPREEAWKQAEGGASADAGVPAWQAERIRASLAELAGLRQMNVAIQMLLDRDLPLQPVHTNRVFMQLPRMRKRVVLVIDEFDQMMREANFSNNLWAFLRGASTQGKILTIVSSPVHLMDSSLHEKAEVTYDRLNLFNHYQTQFLDPFKREEADGFLDWLGPAEPPLTPEERDYIYELGGGSPHFLKKARQLFLQHRPATPEQRTEFERLHVWRVFEPDLKLMWGRFSNDERGVLEQLVREGKCADPLADKLEREGYVAKRGGCNHLFSTVFEKFIQIEGKVRKQPAAAKPAPLPDAAGLVTFGPVQPLTKTFASAMGLALPEETPIFKVEVKNGAAEEIRVEILCHVLNYSDSTKRTFIVPAGETQTLRGCAVFKGKPLRELPNAVPANVEWSLTWTQKSGRKQKIDHGQFAIQLLPPNHFQLGLWDNDEQVIRNQTWLIAAWVRRHGPMLQVLLNEASAYCTLSGPDAKVADPSEHLRKQVGALYRAVKDRKLSYQNSARVAGAPAEQYLQEVRLPEQTLKDKAANCLDMAVLFASLMLSCQIDPVILFVPNHAIVGWHDGAGNLEFLQTTGIGGQTFEQACAEGRVIYEARKIQSDASRNARLLHIENSDDFAIAVDVIQVVTELRMTKI